MAARQNVGRKHVINRLRSPDHASLSHQAQLSRRRALAGLDEAAKNKVNAINADYQVKWIRSYATADKTVTFCIYEGPSEQAVREAGTANGLPVDEMFQVPVTLVPDGEDLVVH